VEISLAKLLIDRRDDASLDEAVGLLHNGLDRKVSQFPNVMFRWHLALIRLVQVKGDLETIQRSARAAFELVPEARSFPVTSTLELSR
jgi:hypothetical protein